MIQKKLGLTAIALFLTTAGAAITLKKVEAQTQDRRRNKLVIRFKSISAAQFVRYALNQTL